MIFYADLTLQGLCCELLLCDDNVVDYVSDAMGTDACQRLWRV